MKNLKKILSLLLALTVSIQYTDFSSMLIHAEDFESNPPVVETENNTDDNKEDVQEEDLHNESNPVEDNSKLTENDYVEKGVGDIYEYTTTANLSVVNPDGGSITYEGEPYTDAKFVAKIQVKQTSRFKYETILNESGKTLIATPHDGYEVKITKKKVLSGNIDINGNSIVLKTPTVLLGVGMNQEDDVEIVFKKATEVVMNEGISFPYTRDIEAIKNILFDEIDKDNSVLPEDAVVEDFKYEIQYGLKDLVNEALGSKIAELITTILPDQDVWVNIGSNTFGEVLKDNGLGALIKAIDKLSPGASKTKVNVLAVGQRTVGVQYLGDDQNLESERATVDVTITKVKAKVDVKNASIVYGAEIPKDFIVTTPYDDIDRIDIYAGVDGDAHGFVSIILPNKLAYNILAAEFPNGFTLNDIIEVLEKLDVFIDTEALNKILNGIPSAVREFHVKINEQPTNAGAYVVGSVTIGTDFYTAADIGGLAILPVTKDISLKFNQDLPSENIIPYADRESFVFGGQLFDADGNPITDANVRTSYSGLSMGGISINRDEPILEPGIYTETVYVLGGNYLVKPISRIYTIQKSASIIEFDDNDVTTTYNGEPQGLAAGVYDENDEKFADASIFYTRVDGIYSSKNAPTDAGTYIVSASYFGDEDHGVAIVKLGRLVIQKAPEATVTIDDITTTYGESTDKSDYTYSTEGIVDKDIATIAKNLTCTSKNVNVGSHKIGGIIDFKTAKNYKNVVLVKGTHEIIKKDITVNVGDVDVTYGDKEKTATWALADGSELEYKDTIKGLKVVLTRERGTDAGSYAITGTAKNTNYQVTFVEGTYTIAPKAIKVQLSDAKAVYGDAETNIPWVLSNGSTLAYKDTSKDLNVVVTRDLGKNVGTYAIHATWTNKNYKITFNTDATYVIEAKEIVLKVDNKQKKVEEKDPELTYTVSKLVGDDELDVVLTREKGETVGTYKINAVVKENSNYKVNVIAGTFTIKEKPADPIPPVKPNTPDEPVIKETGMNTGISSTMMLYVSILALSGFAIVLGLRKKEEK